MKAIHGNGRPSPLPSQSPSKIARHHSAMLFRRRFERDARLTAGLFAIFTAEEMRDYLARHPSMVFSSRVQAMLLMYATHLEAEGTPDGQADADRARMFRAMLLSVRHGGWDILTEFF